MATPATPAAATAADTSADTTSAASPADIATPAGDVDSHLRNAVALKERHDELQKQYSTLVQKYVRRAYNSAKEYRLDPNQRLTLASTILTVDARHNTTNQLTAIKSVLGYVAEDNDTHLQHSDVIQLRHELVKTSVTSELPKLQKFAVSLLKQSIRVLVGVEDTFNFKKINEIDKFISEVDTWLTKGADDPMPNVSGTEKGCLQYSILSQYNSYFTQGSISDGRPYKLLHTLQSMTSGSSDAGKTPTEWFDELKRVLTEFTMAKLVCSGSSQLTVFDTVMDTQLEELCHDTAELNKRVMSMAEQRSQLSVASGANESSASLTSAQYDDPYHEFNKAMLKLVSTDESSNEKDLMVEVVRHGMRHRSTTSTVNYRDNKLESIDTRLGNNKNQRVECVKALKAEIDQLEAQETDSQTNIADLAERIRRLDRTDHIRSLIIEANQILGVDLSNEQSLLGDVTTSAHLCQKLDVIRDPQNKEKYFSMSHKGQSNAHLQQMRAVVMIAKALARVEPGDTAQLQVRDAVFLDNERRDFEKAQRESEGWLTRAKNWLLTLGRAPQSSRSNDDASPLVGPIKRHYREAIRRPATTGWLSGLLSSVWKYITSSEAARVRHESRRNESGVVGIQLVESHTLRSLKQLRSEKELKIRNRKPRLKALKEQKSSLEKCDIQQKDSCISDAVSKEVDRFSREQKEKNDLLPKISRAKSSLVTVHDHCEQFIILVELVKEDMCNETVNSEDPGKLSMTSIEQVEKSLASLEQSSSGENPFYDKLVDGLAELKSQVSVLRRDQQAGVDKAVFDCQITPLEMSVNDIQEKLQNQVELISELKKQLSKLKTQIQQQAREEKQTQQVDTSESGIPPLVAGARVGEPQPPTQVETTPSCRPCARGSYSPEADPSSRRFGSSYTPKERDGDGFPRLRRSQSASPGCGHTNRGDSVEVSAIANGYERKVIPTVERQSKRHPRSIAACNSGLFSPPHSRDSDKKYCLAVLDEIHNGIKGVRREDCVETDGFRALTQAASP